MVNVVLDRNRKYSVSFNSEYRKFGPGENGNRFVVNCKLYTHDREFGTFYVTEGMAILNPLDQYNERIGLHKALDSALNNIFDRDEKKIFHDTIEGWYTT